MLILLGKSTGVTMKQGIHPTYNKDAVIKCACGASYLVGSTEKELFVEICSSCHPFYTGKQKLVDTAGRVDKFKARVNAASNAKVKKEAPKVENEEAVEIPTLQTELEDKVINEDNKSDK